MSPRRLLAAVSLLAVLAVVVPWGSLAHAGHIPPVNRTVVCTPSVSHLAVGSGGNPRTLTIQNVGTLHVNVGWLNPSMAATQLGAFQGWTLHVGGVIQFNNLTTGILCQTQPGTGSTAVEVLDGDATGITVSPGVASITGGAISASVNQSGSWTVQAAHQGGQWNIAHVGAVSHVAITSDFSGAGAGNRVCHSQTAFMTSANAIIAHGAAGKFIYICGFVLGNQQTGLGTGETWTIVSGTGAACATTVNQLIGPSTAAAGFHLSTQVNPSVIMIQRGPWIASTTAADQICLLKSGGGRMTGILIYGAY